MDKFNNGYGSYQSPSTGMQQATPFTYNMFDTEAFKRTIDIPDPNAPMFSGTTQPKFSDMGSIMTPAPVGYGSVLSPQSPQQMLPQLNPSTVAPSTPVSVPVSSPVSSPVSAQQVIANPAAAGVTSQVYPYSASVASNPYDFKSRYGDDSAMAFTGGSLDENANSLTDKGAGTGMFADMKGKDWLGAGFGTVMTGLGAYNMFRGLDQKDTQLDQGQQALDLTREEYAENLRHRQAIVAQNRGA